MIGRVLFAAILAGIAAGFVMSAAQMWQVTPLIAQAESQGHAQAHDDGNGEGNDHGHAHEAAGGDHGHGHDHGEEAAGHDHDTEHGHAHSHENAADHGHSHDGHSHEDGQSHDDGHSHEDGHSHDDAQSHDDGHGHTHAGWMPEDGIERTTFTILANVVTGAGFALVLVAAALFSGREITAANGAVWGVVGFLVFAVAPAAGLPPEIPGTGGGEVVPRQLWWVATAAATAAGIAGLVLYKDLPAKLIAVAVIALPHAFGAPVQPFAGSSVPPELAARFVGASLATAAIFWVVLGVTLGWLMQRGAGREEATI